MSAPKSSTPDKESTTRNRILLSATKRGLRLFINRVGKGWTGSVARRTAGTITLSPYRTLEAGFGRGSSDLIGMTPVEITPDMVGRVFAVFTAVEVKSETGRPTAEQLEYVALVRSWGGIAVVAKSAADVDGAVDGFMMNDKLD